MEITAEIKKAIVYQYYGKEYVYKNEFGTYSDVIGGFHTNTHIQYDSFKLKLKPLSTITDEDFVELAKVCGYVIGKVNRNDHHIWGDYINNGGVHTGTFSINTEKSVYKGKITTVPSNGNPRQDIYTCSALNGFQYLQSKGYDLPNYLLEGKTLQEVGLAIYTK